MWAFAEMPHFVTRGSPCSHPFLLQRCGLEREVDFLSSLSTGCRASSSRCCSRRVCKVVVISTLGCETLQYQVRAIIPRGTYHLIPGFSLFSPPKAGSGDPINRGHREKKQKKSLHWARSLWKISASLERGGEGYRKTTFIGSLRFSWPLYPLDFFTRAMCPTITISPPFIRETECRGIRSIGFGCRQFCFQTFPNYTYCPGSRNSVYPLYHKTPNA